MQAAKLHLCICASLVFLSVTFGAGANAQSEPWHREAHVEETVTVTKVDPQTRLIAVRNDKGRTTAVYAGPKVRNFDRIKVGDLVVVSYHTAIAAAVTAPGEAAGTSGAVTLKRAEPGQQPHGGLEASVTTTVQIESVDAESNTITFRREDGSERTAQVEDEKARKFIRSLKKGDLVTVTYSEAVAVSVRPAPGTADTAR